MSWPSSKSPPPHPPLAGENRRVGAFQVVPAAALNPSVSARRKLDVFVNKEEGTAGRRDPNCLRLERRPFNSLIECSTAITSSRLQASSALATTERRQIKVDRKSAKVAATADYKSSGKTESRWERNEQKADPGHPEPRAQGKCFQPVDEYQDERLDFRRHLRVIDHPRT